jgi:hypothetical protein
VEPAGDAAARLEQLLRGHLAGATARGVEKRDTAHGVLVERVKSERALGPEAY